MSIDGNSSKTSFMKARNVALRLECSKQREIRNIEITKRSNLMYAEAEMRSARIFLSLVKKSSGSCEHAIETTGRENEMLRKKLQSNPRMTFDNYDGVAGFTSKSLRNKYCLQFDIDYVIYRHNKARKLFWPKV